MKEFLKALPLKYIEGGDWAGEGGISFFNLKETAEEDSLQSCIPARRSGLLLL